MKHLQQSFANPLSSLSLSKSLFLEKRRCWFNPNPEANRSTDEHVDSLADADEIKGKTKAELEAVQQDLKSNFLRQTYSVKIHNKTSHLRVRNENGAKIGELRINDRVKLTGETKVTEDASGNETNLGPVKRAHLWVQIEYAGEGNDNGKAWVSAEYLEPVYAKLKEKPTEKAPATPPPQPQPAPEKAPATAPPPPPAAPVAPAPAVAPPAAPVAPKPAPAEWGFENFEIASGTTKEVGKWNGKPVSITNNSDYELKNPKTLSDNFLKFEVDGSSTFTPDDILAITIVPDGTIKVFKQNTLNSEYTNITDTLEENGYSITFNKGNGIILFEKAGSDAAE